MYSSEFCYLSVTWAIVHSLVYLFRLSRYSFLFQTFWIQKWAKQASLHLLFPLPGNRFSFLRYSHVWLLYFSLPSALMLSQGGLLLLSSIKLCRLLNPTCGPTTTLPNHPVFFFFFLAQHLLLSDSTFYHVLIAYLLSFFCLSHQNICSREQVPVVK